jgi:hypothetical protein
MRFITDLITPFSIVTRRGPWAFAAACGALIVTSACSTSPSSTDPYQGTWTGSIVDRAAGPGTLRVELRAGASVEGSWTAVVGGAALTGTLASGSSQGAQRSFAVGCAPGSMLWATTVDGNRMSGTYITAGCSGLSGGSLDLVRQ